jgi:large subunit ribosomal protein L9
MDVILLERIAKLGQMGDIVRVKDGYGRNYLLAQGKALRATEANKKRFDEQRAQLEARNLESRKEAEDVAAKLDGQRFVLIRSAAESGALYGSVTARDIADAATEGGFSITRGQVQIDQPVKELGLHQIGIALHPEVVATITINVARSPDEAEIQSTGKTIKELRAEEEAAGEFEIAELFDDLGAAAHDDDGPIEDVDSRADEQPRI